MKFNTTTLFIEGNMRKYSHSLELGKEFIYYTKNVHIEKQELTNHTLNFFLKKKFCSVKNMVKRLKI